jgi:tocopherol O-methyltransferase
LKRLCAGAHRKGIGTSSSTPQYPVAIDRIRKHYDRLSFLYRLFWGEHLHHGYWDGDESVARAQIQLMERLAERAGISRGMRVLDIGCGLGGSALWLAEQFDCDVTGMTISPVQARMAAGKAKTRGLAEHVRFQVEDANEWQPQPASVDVIWIMESSEHFRDKPGFFEGCARALKPGGILAVCAWLRRDGPLNEAEQRLVDTIAEAMMSASLGSLSDYRRWIEDAGLTVTAADDITRHVEQTWAHCSRIGKNPFVRLFLPFTGGPTQRFVRSFPYMQRAYAQGAMAFGLLVAKKPA